MLLLTSFFVDINVLTNSIKHRVPIFFRGQDFYKLLIVDQDYRNNSLSDESRFLKPVKSFKFFQRYFCQMNHRTWNGRGNNELTPKQNIVITTPINLCMIILFIKKFEKPSDDVCLRCRYRSCIIRELFNKSSFILLLNLF